MQSLYLGVWDMWGNAWQSVFLQYHVPCVKGTKEQTVFQKD